MLRHPLAFSSSANTDQPRTAMTRAIVRWGVRAA